MDYDSSSKFISSLAKFLQSLCNGYVEFDTGVQVIGHLYLSVDTGKTIDYILNEKVCKTDENSVTFISNSFHAQPAERPKPPGKRQVKDLDKAELKNDMEPDGCISGQVEPRSTNVGTIPAARSIKQNSPHAHGGKRPYSPSLKQSQSKSGRTSPKHKKSRNEPSDLVTSQLPNPAGENSSLSAPSPTADIAPSNSVSARGSDAPDMNESFPQAFYPPDEESSLADESDERDVKPSIDTDVTFIKEEFAPSSAGSQLGGQSHDRLQGDDSYPYQSNQTYPASYPGQGGFGASQRSNFSSSGPSHLFSPGQSSSQIEENSGDPSDIKRGTSDESTLGVKHLHDSEIGKQHKYGPAKRRGIPHVVKSFSQAESGDQNSSVMVHRRVYANNSPNRDAEEEFEPKVVFPESDVSLMLSSQGDGSGTEAMMKIKPSKAKGVFECALCGKGYSYMRGLQRHWWICADVKRVHCEYCDMSFNIRQQYKKHLKAAHPSVDIDSGQASHPSIEFDIDPGQAAHPSIDIVPGQGL